MMVNTPFFISPAYSVPRITISRAEAQIDAGGRDVMPAVCGLAGKLPAL
jgi:hypothetical protein